mmetsp:Transcript_26646/g.74823  ORF Transcript_26646/g.74823 Transcript_26646/m.74823 type:complete len:1025 (-) Transcript_26646:206-3280(-)
MLTVEGLVMGGASDCPGFVDELKGIKDGIGAQISDRRSAVSRVACRVVGQLAVALGNSFEPLAVYFFPIILKVSGITGVQVMVDSAVDAMDTLFTHCRARGSVPLVLSTVAKDKNKVLRANCAKLLTLILEVWERKVYEKHIDAVEKTIAAALQDAQGDVRNYGRLCYGAYSVACPDRVSVFLRALPAGLQDKMIQAGAEYCRQSPEEPVVPPRQVQTARPGTAPARRVSELPAVPQRTKRASENVGAKPPVSTTTRNTVAGGALRITTPAEDPFDDVPSSGRRSSLAKAGPPGRVLNSQQQQRPSSASGARPPASKQHEPDFGPKRVPSAYEAPARRANTDDDTWSVSTGSAPSTIGSSMSLASIVNRIKAAKSATDWERRRDGFVDLRDWVAENGPVATGELSRLMDGLVPLIVDSSKDAHHQVVVVVLEAWGEMAKHSSRAQEPYIERLMACAFLRAVDAKAVIRAAALNALRAVARSFPADSLLVSLNKCMNSSKSGKGKMAVMEFSIESLGAGTPAGVPSGGHPSVSMWLESISKLLQDRSAEVRRCASSALEHAYKNMDPRSVLVFILASPASEQAVLKRALKGVPSFPADMLAFERNGGFSLVGNTLSAADRARLVNQAGRERRSSSEGQGSPASDGVATPATKPSFAPQPQAVDVIVYQCQVSPGPAAPLPAAPLHGVVNEKPASPGQAAMDDKVRPHSPAQALANISNLKLEAREQQGDFSALFPASTPPYAGLPAGSNYFPSAYTSTPASTPGSATPRLDPAAIPAMLSRLVTQLSSGSANTPVLYETLKGIQAASSQAPDTAWDNLFIQTVYGLMSVLETEDLELEYQETAAETLKMMAFNQTTLFVPYLEAVIPKLLHCRRRATGPERNAIDMSIEELVTNGDPRKGLEVLCARLHDLTVIHGPGTAEPDPAILSGVLRNIGNAARTIGATELSNFVPSIMNGLMQAFDSRAMEVRKEVVRCFVCLWWTLGDGVEPYLGGLSESQRKVIGIYIEKNRKRRARGGLAGPVMWG